VVGRAVAGVTVSTVIVVVKFSFAVWAFPSVIVVSERAVVVWGISFVKEAVGPLAVVKLVLLLTEVD